MKHKSLLMLAVAAAVSLVSFAAQAAGLDVAGFLNEHRDALMGIALMGSVQLPNGSIVSVASGYGAAKTMTGISNASTAQASLAAGHGISFGDIMEITSGWSRLTNKIVRAGNPVGSPGTVIPLDNIDSSNPTFYPAGGGAGSVREILGWTQLQQILTVASSGGDQQFLTYQFLESDSQQRIPTVKNPAGIDFEIADDPSLAGYILCKAANDDRLARAVRIALPSGALIFYNAFISLTPVPQLTINDLVKAKITLSLLADPVRYQS